MGFLNEKVEDLTNGHLKKFQWSFQWVLLEISWNDQRIKILLKPICEQ